MYTLSRILPDGKRPISAGMLSRAEDTVTCELLAHETVEVAYDDEALAQVSLDEQGHVGFVSLGELVHFRMSANGPAVAVAIFNEEDLMAVATYTPALLPDDIRLFVKVFPLAAQETPAPSE